MTEEPTFTGEASPRLDNENAIRKEIEKSLSKSEGMSPSSREELERELARVERSIRMLGGEALLERAA